MEYQRKVRGHPLPGSQTLRSALSTVPRIFPSIPLSRITLRNRVTGTDKESGTSVKVSPAVMTRHSK
jgi:hypothetical protein